MTFFNEYKNNSKLKRKYVDNISKSIEDEYFFEQSPSVLPETDNKIEDTLKNLSSVKEKIKSDILNEKITANPFFDEQLFNHLDNLHSYISGYIPKYPKYYNDKKEINPKAFLDARDIIKNELPFSVDEILNTSTNISGVMNDTKMNFENGFQVDSDGNVYGPNKNIIFNPNNPTERVKFIDLLNKKVVTENGIRIDMPDNFINEFIKGNEYINSTFVEKLTNYEIKINKNNNKQNNNFENDNFNDNNNGNNNINGNGSGENDNNQNGNNQNGNEQGNNFGNSDNVNLNNKASNTIIIDDIYATVNGVPITFEDRIFVEMPLEDVFIGDIFGEEPNINLIEKIEKYNIREVNLGICNFKDIPYAELNSKLFWGGGQKGLKPLASNNISDKDISFAPNGTVYYSGSNSTVSTHRSGCRSKTYKTGHVCMWSESNKMGLKTSIIQYIYKFCNTFGLFNANIPPLMGYKKFKVFPGLCIGGLLEMALCGWQERISKRINEMFQCVPSKMPTDDSKSVFENSTFPHGTSVDNLQELDKINSCKFGDRYVVDAVSTDVTGLKDIACGMFVFDPNDKLANAYKWKYKVWRGKPFNPKDNNEVIKDFSNMYENPIIQDLLMNTNALGEDSITRKLMSLQYAYMKKQSLLAVSDVEISMDAIVEQTIYQVLEKLTNRISDYIALLDYKEEHQNDDSISDIPSGGVPIEFANIFLNTFSYLTNNNILKSCPLDKCLRKKIKYSGGSSSGASSITIRYYDFSGYDPNEYLVPSYNNISNADCIAFSSMYIPSEELKEVYNNNLEFLQKLGADYQGLKNVKTIREFINTSDNKEAFEKDIEDNLKYIEYDLNYSGFDSRAIEQSRKRCFYTFDSKIVFK